LSGKCEGISECLESGHPALRNTHSPPDCCGAISPQLFSEVSFETFDIETAVCVLGLGTGGAMGHFSLSENFLLVGKFFLEKAFTGREFS